MRLRNGDHGEPIVIWIGCNIGVVTMKTRPRRRVDNTRAKKRSALPQLCHFGRGKACTTKQNSASHRSV
jgi:hypothetical protein